MEIKKLNWRDNITENGKTFGFFTILSDVDDFIIKISNLSWIS